ncbi:MAG: ATP-binding cassette domain-containing protein [Candidatus Bipolaricaulaceae bacterium]
MDAVLELREVWAAYPGGRGAALRGASLRLAPGELGLLLGPNGAGKTTILEVFLGFVPYRGEAKVFGLEVRAHAQEVRRRLGYLPQALFFPPDAPCRTLDLVVMGRFGLFRPWRRLPRAERDRAFAALARLGLAEKADWPIGHLSGGQQRKALLARALAKGAAALLLDEPFASLDPEARRDLAQAILRLREEGLTVLAVVHEEELLARADRAWFVREGRTFPLAPPLRKWAEVWAGLCGR